MKLWAKVTIAVVPKPQWNRNKICKRSATSCKISINEQVTCYATYASSCKNLSRRNTYQQQGLSKHGVLIHWISLLYIEGSSNNKNSSCHATEDGVFHSIAKTNTNSSPIWHIFNIDTPQCWITYPIYSANRKPSILWVLKQFSMLWVCDTDEREGNFDIVNRDKNEHVSTNTLNFSWEYVRDVIIIRNVFIYEKCVMCRNCGEQILFIEKKKLLFIIHVFYFFLFNVEMLNRKQFSEIQQRTDQRFSSTFIEIESK